MWVKCVSASWESNPPNEITSCCSAYSDCVKCRPDICCLISKVGESSNSEKYIEFLIIFYDRLRCLCKLILWMLPPSFLRTTLPLYSQLSSLGVIVLSHGHAPQRPVIMSHASNVVWKHYAADKNQTIRRTISAYPALQLTHLTIIRVGSWNIHQSAW